MHYVKAVGWIILTIGLWISAHFVALILGLAILVRGIAIIIKMEKDDEDSRDT